MVLVMDYPGFGDLCRLSYPTYTRECNMTAWTRAIPRPKGNGGRFSACTVKKAMTKPSFIKYEAYAVLKTERKRHIQKTDSNI